MTFLNCQIGRSQIVIQRRAGYGESLTRRWQIEFWRKQTGGLWWIAVGSRTLMLRRQIKPWRRGYKTVLNSF